MDSLIIKYLFEQGLNFRLYNQFVDENKIKEQLKSYEELLTKNYKIIISKDYLLYDNFLIHRTRNEDIKLNINGIDKPDGRTIRMFYLEDSLLAYEYL